MTGTDPNWNRYAMHLHRTRKPLLDISDIKNSRHKQGEWEKVGSANRFRVLFIKSTIIWSLCLCFTTKTLISYYLYHIVPWFNITEITKTAKTKNLMTWKIAKILNLVRPFIELKRNFDNRVNGQKFHF